MKIILDIWQNYLVHFLDIAIISYLIYRLLLLFRGTRTIQIFLGVVLLFIATIISKIMGLTTVYWIISQFWVAGIIFIAIIFQQEIRSVLAYFGARPLMKYFMVNETEFINKIFAAVRELSVSKTGALIVFEKKMGLMNYVESGKILNAYTEKELLLSIFAKGSPLHDGAVIIRNTLIFSAGSILPLSIEKNIPHGATRHRAALGLSEITDALIIVVSEETGEVSVASDGRLHYNVNIDDEEKKIMKTFSENRKANE